MLTAWPLQEAKDRFPELVTLALEDGPQTVTRGGEPVVVVVSLEMWRRLTEAGTPNLGERPPSLAAVDAAREQADHGETARVFVP